MEVETRHKVVVLGSGQLGRMLALASYPLGIECVFVDSSPEPAVTPLAPYVAHSGKITGDIETLLNEASSITFEFENIPLELVRGIDKIKKVFPPVEALAATQERFAEKRLFSDLKIPTAEYLEISSENPSQAEELLRKAATLLGMPYVIKHRRLGYDGKGQLVVRNESDLGEAVEFIRGKDAIAEKFIPFERELSIIAVRGKDGKVCYYPLTENLHRDGILRTSIAPASQVDSSTEQAAKEYAKRILTQLEYVGVLALELFHTREGLIANEVAPRVHNSGHWTLNGCEVSQFENHMRAVLGLPVGEPKVRGVSLMLNLIGQGITSEKVLSVSGVHLHWYGKSVRPQRKVGHINIQGLDKKDLLQKFEQLAPLCGLEPELDRVRRALQ